jgi:hypothetical protein
LVLLVFHLMDNSFIQSHETAEPRKVTHVQQFEFIREHFMGIDRDSIVLSWLVRNGHHLASASLLYELQLNELLKLKLSKSSGILHL